MYTAQDNEKYCLVPCCILHFQLAHKLNFFSLFLLFVINTHRPSIRCWQKVSNIKQTLIAICITNYVELKFFGYVSPFSVCHEWWKWVSKFQKPGPVCWVRDNSQPKILSHRWHADSCIFWQLIALVLASLGPYFEFSALLNTHIFNNLMLMATGNVCKVSKNVCLPLL
jgi:hypothetical protein